MDRQQYRQIGGRLGDLDPADGIQEHILVEAGNARMPVQHRQQQRQPVLLQAHRQPARVGHVGGVDQRLDLHQQRARALLRHQHARTGHGLLMLRQEQRRRVADAAQPALGHGEHAQLVDRAEAVLEGTDQPVRGMRIALEVQHRVDDMLQHARPGQAAFLGHVADQDDGDAAALGDARQLRRALAHLRDRARRRGQRLRVERLDRVDHRHFRLLGFERGLDLLELDFGEQPQRRAFHAQPLRTQGDLRAGFFAADIEHAALPGQVGQRLQQQRGLADAGIAADQHHAARHQPAAQHAVELVDAAGKARHVGSVDLGQLAHHGRCRQRLEALGRGRLGHRFHQRVPLLAMRALAGPARGGAAAFGTGVDGLGLGQRKILAGKNRPGAEVARPSH
ncbi:hypothetical protein D3C81_1154020 [compost metagenome]